MTVGWDKYKEALKFGETLRKGVKDGDIPRTLLHFLLRLYHTHVHEDNENPMWATLLHYTLAKRLERTVEVVGVDKAIEHRSLPIALGYAILATRERMREEAMA